MLKNLIFFSALYLAASSPLQDNIIDNDTQRYVIEIIHITVWGGQTSENVPFREDPDCFYIKG